MNKEQHKNEDFFREAAFHELGVYSKNDGNAVGIFSPKNVSIFFLGNC